PAFVVGLDCNVIAGHAWSDLSEQTVENLVLHLRRLADQILLLLALDRLRAVDEIGCIHEGRLAGELAFDACDKSVRHRAAANPSDRAVAAKLSGDEFRLVLVRVGNAGESRRTEPLSHAPR